VTSDVVGSGWTHVTFLRTVDVGSPGLASFTPLSGGGRGPWFVRAIDGASNELPRPGAGPFRGGLNWSLAVYPVTLILRESY
jgi:hypothetical protein